MIAQLLFLESEDPDERSYCIYINSPGGLVSAGLAIYDTMQYISCEAPVDAAVHRLMAASMAAVLLAGGKRESAMPLPNSAGHDPPGFGRIPRLRDEPRDLQMRE